MVTISSQLRSPLQSPPHGPQFTSTKIRSSAASTPQGYWSCPAPAPIWPRTPSERPSGVKRWMRALPNSQTMIVPSESTARS